jgi:hypothetical protein
MANEPLTDIEQVREVETPFIFPCISRRSNMTQGRRDDGIGYRGTLGPLGTHR